MEDSTDNELAGRVLAIWAAILGNPRLALDDDLPESGLSSLAAIRGLAALRRDLGRGISLDDLLRLRTPRRITQALTSRETVEHPESTGASRPLSTQQQAMATKLAGRPDASYVLTDVFELHGEVDVERLLAAVTRLPARHEALRMLVSGTAEGVILPPEDPRVLRTVVELPDPLTPSELFALLNRPFDLASEVPFRAVLGRDPDGSHLVGLATHHICSDAWSHHLLLDDIADAYNGRQLDLETPSYWAARTDDSDWSPVPWDGIFDRDYAAVRALAPTTPDSPVHRATVDVPGLATAFRTARNEQSSSELFVAAVLRALAQLLGDSEVIVGMPSAGRMSPDALQAVGYFSNTVFIGVDVSQLRSDEALLAEVARQVLIGRTQLSRDWRELVPAAKHDLFTVRVIGDAPEDVTGLPELSGLTLERIDEPAEDTASRPIAAQFSLDGDHLTITCTCRADVLSSETTHQLASLIGANLAAVCASSAARS
jgi:hypothetical protein